MTRLFEALTGEAQECLIRDGVVELVSIVVRAIPDPDREDNRNVMTIAAESGMEFVPGLPCTDAVCQGLREICLHANEDLSEWTHEDLLVALNRRRKEIDGLKAGKIGGQTIRCLTDPRLTFLQPIIQATKAEVAIWGLAWTASMYDSGKMFVDCEEHFYSTAIDGVTRKNIQERIRLVNTVVGREVIKLLGGV